jgi:hypothetical protein
MINSLEGREVISNTGLLDVPQDVYRVDSADTSDITAWMVDVYEYNRDAAAIAEAMIDAEYINY